MLSLITLLLITYMNTIQCTIYCRDYRECYDETMNKDSEAISCEGDEACAFSNNVIGTGVSCLGNYACRDVSVIRAYDYSVNCWGNSACYQAGYITAYEGGSVYCDGRYSCYKAGRLHEAYTSVYCRGYMSCKDVGLITAPTVYCNGKQSCLTTTISSYISTDSIDSTLHATGEGATSGSVYICQEAAESCTVICEGTGCQNLLIVYPNKKSDITLTPKSCKSEANQGKDIASDEIVMVCPTLISADDYAAGGGKIKHELNDDMDMELFAEVDSETFLSSHQSMNVKEILFYGSMMVNGILFASCVYQRYKKKEYLPL